MKTWLCRALQLFAVLGAGDPATAQARPDSRLSSLDSLPGRLFERTVAESDTTQAFAVYISSRISADTLAPVVFVMDPRGRALLAAALFAPAAEELGYVVISSYNTMSDGPLEPNVAAINAMIRSAPAFSADISRIYLSGFSGTARLGWDFVLQLGNRSAGYYAVGGAPILAPPSARAPLRRQDFAFAASAGSADFNYHEVWSVRESLRSEEIPHYIAFFDGQHSWPPADDVTDVMFWFEARAAMSGRAKRDSVWIRARIADQFARAQEHERSGSLLLAAEVFADIARNYRGWAMADSAAQHARRLSDGSEVMKARRRIRALAAEHGERMASTQLELTQIRLERKAPTLERVADRLELKQTLARLSRADSLERPWIRQLLASMHVQLAFYEPRDYIQTRQGDRALTMLRAARLIAPWTPAHCALALEAAAISGASSDDDVLACRASRSQ